MLLLNVVRGTKLDFRYDVSGDDDKYVLFLVVRYDEVGILLPMSRRLDAIAWPLRSHVSRTVPF